MIRMLRSAFRVVIRVHLSPSDLGRIRFGSSALLESSLALRHREERGADSLLASVAAPLLRARKALSVRLSDALHEDGRYVPDFLPPRGLGMGVAIEDDLDALRTYSEKRTMRRLAFAYPDGIPDDLRLFRLAPRAALGTLADELGAVWDNALAPVWPAMRALVEADVTYRARRLVLEGAEGLFDDLHPSVGYRNGVLEIESRRDAELRPAGRGLTLMPTVFAWPGVYAVADPRAHAGLAYPPRGLGLLDEALAARRPLDRLARLVGSGRAAVLRAASDPVTTQELSLRLGVTPSAVSQHLSALAEAGLVQGTRVGRRVYYRVNEDGARMLEVLAERNPERVGPRLV
jgi:DNA-binding transcriptional ArsR family regulator